MKLDHFVKGEGLDPFTIKVKRCAYLYDRRAEAEGRQGRLCPVAAPCQLRFEPGLHGGHPSS